MSRVRARNTQPEVIVRRFLWRAGFRYRLHASRLPGRPDIVLRSLGLALFVHGCFWHRHSCPSGLSSPKTHRAYWRLKFENNCRRDRSAVRALRASGWRAAVIWECQTRDSRKLEARLLRLLRARDRVK